VKNSSEPRVKKPAPSKKKVDPKIELAGQALHDEIGPLLSAAGLRLQLLRMDFPQTAERVHEITQTLDEAIDRIRALSQELKPSPFSAKGSRNSKRGYN
jgi:signal transduction histidine kinase